MGKGSRELMHGLNKIALNSSWDSEYMNPYHALENKICMSYQDDKWKRLRSNSILVWKKEVVEQIGSSLNVWVREGSQPELVPHDKGLSK